MEKHFYLLLALFFLAVNDNTCQENTCKARVLDHEIDVLTPVEGNRALIGSFGYRSLLWEMKAGEYQMIDNNTGQIIWQHNRKNVTGVNEKVLLTTPLILIKSEYENKLRYYTLDPVTGEEVWEFKLNSKKGTSLLLNEDKIVFVETPGNNLEIDFYDIQSGKLIKELTYNDFYIDRKSLPSVYHSTDKIVVMGNEIICFSLLDYKFLWKEDIEKGTRVFVRDGFLLVQDIEGISSKNFGTGENTWKAPVKKVQDFIIEDGLLYFIATPGDKNRFGIIKNGQVIWKTDDIEGEIKSGLNGKDKMLYFTTSKNLYCIDPSAQKIRFTTPLPETFHYVSMLPDQFKFLEEKIIVTSETGISYFSLPGGKLKGYYHVQGSECFSSDFLLAKIQALTIGNCSQKHQRKKMLAELENSGSLPSNPSKYNYSYSNIRNSINGNMWNNFLMSSWQHRTNIVNSNYNQTWKNSAIQTHASYEQLAASMQVTQATMDLVMAGISAGQQLVLLRMQMALEIKKKELEHALDNYSKCLTDKYFTRMYYTREKGWGLAIFDLMDEKRADIKLGDPLDELQINAADIFACTIDGSTLMYKFVKPTNNEEFNYDLNGCGPGYVSKNFLNRVKFTSSYPCINMIDIENLNFQKPPGFTPEPLAGYNDKEAELLDHMLFQRRKEALKLIQSGINPDSRDKHGITLLMYSSLFPHKKVTRALMKITNQIEAEDFDRWNALHYSLLGNTSTPGKNPVSHLKKALLKKLK